MLPSTVLTVISVVPALTATTFPLVSTVAMVESLDDHVTFLFVAFAGKIVATRVSVAPTTSDNVVLLSAIAFRANYSPASSKTGFPLNARVKLNVCLALAAPPNGTIDVIVTTD